MSDETWVPAHVPLDRPSPARIYDYLLGGYHNFAVDRVIADRMLEISPQMRSGAQANRAFLRRAVRFLAERGVEQFLDLGSGIPTLGNVHEVAQAENPSARVVYVDIDPVAVAHARSMLADNPRAVAVRADVRHPESILSHPEVQSLLHFDQPLGLLFVSVLHYVVEDALAFDLVRNFAHAVVPGSYLVVAHSTDAFELPERQQLRQLFEKASPTRSRSPSEIERFFDGFELVEPGLVHTPLWQPEGSDDLFHDRPAQAFTLAGMARKP